MNSKNEPVKIVMVSIGGYGYYYLRVIFDEFPRGEVEVAAVVDPFAESCRIYPEIQKRKIPAYKDLESFYADGHKADLVIISSPIQFHIPQTCTALKNGSHVLCDKPLGTSIQEADEMISLSEETGRWIMIGYQWSFSQSILDLKKDIIDQVFGKPIRLKTICLWPRGDDYYHRNNWAGKLKDEKGRWILDSPVNNAMAHYVHNQFYVLGKEINTSAYPDELTAELYRATPIENYDTAAIRIKTPENVEILFYGSHVSEVEKGPMFQFEFENAMISFAELHDDIIAVFRDGRTKRYPSPFADHQFKKTFEAVKKVRDPGIPVVCGPEASRPQLICTHGAQESVPDVQSLPERMTVRNEKEQRWMAKGLDTVLFECYQKGILPSEAGYSWAVKGKTVQLRDYKRFPSINFKDR